MRPNTAQNTYTKSATDAPIAASLQYLSFPFKALEVMSMLIGPAMGIEKIKPTTSPANDNVMMLFICSEDKIEME